MMSKIGEKACEKSDVDFMNMKKVCDMFNRDAYGKC